MYTYDTRVTMSCTGPDGRQTPVSIVTMMQDCSMLWMDSEPEFARYLRENGAALMVASRQVDFCRFPSYGEKLQVRTWIYKIQKRLGYRNTVIVDEQGGYVAKCWAIGVFVSYDTGSMVALSDEAAASLALDPKLEMEYLKRKIVLPKDEPAELPALVARTSDLDLNGHVNNAQYVRMSADLLPEGFQPRRLRIMHEGQAHAGDIVRPLLYEEPGRRVYVLESADGTLFSTVEWS